MTPHFLAHVFHILEGIDLIAEFTENDKNSLSDSMVYHAVLRVLQTLSESAQKLPEDIKKMHPQVMWRELGKARNYLVHDYLGDIDAETVWVLIKNYLPPLKAAMLIHAPSWPDVPYKE